MDLQTCLKKMELVGVLAFATVDDEGAPQIRNISAIHYEPGDAEIHKKWYDITESCIGCGTCVKYCPQRCIEEGKPYVIRQNNCLHCGNCFEHCPVKAVKKRG